MKDESINKKLIQDISKKMINNDTIINMSEFFKIFGDNTRLKIINVLLNSKMCVGDIASILEMSHSSISHQLRILKQFKIVKFEKHGKLVYYELDDDHIEKIFNEGMEHINE